MATGGLTRGFVGRSRDLDELLESVDATAEGSGGLVVIAGEAGIGKTRLCQQLTREVRRRGLAVGWAAGSDVAPAFWLWSQLLGQLVAGSPDLREEMSTAAALLAGTAPGGASAPADPDLARRDQFDAVASLLTRAGRARPTVLILDDLHWADLPSVRLLAHVAPLLEAIPVLMIATSREHEVPPGTPRGDALAGLERRGRRLALAGLTEDDVAGLITVMTGVPPPARLAAALHHQTGGNPLFAREMVRLLETEGSLEQLAGATGRPPPVPGTVREVLSHRLGRLPRGCRELLAVVSVVGDTAAIEVLEEVTGRDRAALLDQLGEAIAARLIRELGMGRYGFSHPLVRATEYEQLSVARRIRLHERVGLAMEALSARGHAVEPAALAHHFAESSAGGGAARAVRYSMAAAARAMELLAYEDAARLCFQALAALDLDPEAAYRLDILLRLGEAQGAAGDAGAARLTHLEAAALARASDRPRDLARAALGLGGGAGFEITLFDRAQVDLLEEALAGLDPSASSLRALVMARLSVALSLIAAVERRMELSEHAVAMAREVGDGAALAQALAAHCDAIAGPADSERRLEEAGQILLLSAQLDDRRLELLARRLRVVASLEVGDTIGTDLEIEQYGRVADGLRQPGYAWYVQLWRAMRAVMAGRAESWALCDQAEEIGRRAGSPNAVMLCFTHRVFTHLEQGRPEEAVRLVGEADMPDQMLDAQVRVAMSLLQAATGAVDTARAMIDGVPAEVLSGAPVDSEWLPYACQLAEVISRIGGHSLAGWLYEALLPHAHRFAVEGIGAYFRGSVERYLGLLATSLGRTGDASRHRAAAASANRRVGALALAAQALADDGRGPGESTLGAGDHVSAVFRRDGDVWTAGFAGHSVQLRDIRGFHSLARLLDQPGREFPALDLVGARPAAPGRAAWLGLERDLGDVIDAQAREEYRARLAELDADLAEAEAAGDAERSTIAGREREALVDQLSAAYGLGGRPRKAGDPAERARVAATWRLRTAISRIEAAHADLGRHLRRSVRTGTFCSYDPVQPVRWELS